LIINLPDYCPQISDEVAFIADNATIAGNIVIRKAVSVWYQAVLRAESAIIDIGLGSNIQDGVICHTDPGIPLHVGPFVTVGHGAVLHGCTIGENSLIGINAVILNKVTIGKYCLIGAASLVPEGLFIPDGSLVFGAPAKIIRQLTEDEKDGLKRSAREYVEKSKLYRLVNKSSMNK